MIDDSVSYRKLNYSKTRFSLHGRGSKHNQQ